MAKKNTDNISNDICYDKNYNIIQNLWLFYNLGITRYGNCCHNGILEVWEMSYINETDGISWTCISIYTLTLAVSSPMTFYIMMTSSNGNISRVTGPLCGWVRSSRKGQWRGALIFSLICAWIKVWVNNCEAGDLRCHRAHYAVDVMDVLRRSTDTSSHWYFTLTVSSCRLDQPSFKAAFSFPRPPYLGAK